MVKRDGLFIDYCAGWCPVQSEGMFDDEAEYYFRARGQHWSLEITTVHPQLGHKMTKIIAREKYGTGLYDAGHMPHNEARAFIAREYVRWKLGKRKKK